MRSTTFILALAAVCAAGNVIQTGPGQTETLPCGISDRSSNLKWMRGSDLLVSINPSTGMTSKGNGELAKIRTKVKEDKNLEISKITAKDAGVFTCSVKTQQEHHRLVVASVSVSPSGPLEEGSEAVVRCDVYGLPSGEAVQLKRPGGQSEHNPSISIAAVTKADAGLWECVFSAEGKAMKETKTLEVREPRPKTTTTTTTTTTLSAMNSSKDSFTTCSNPDCVGSSGTDPTELSWWVWAAVGGGALVLLLWVLILVMFNRMRRRKRRFIKMRSAAQLRPKQYCQCPGGPTAVAGHRGTKPSAPPFPAPVLSVV